MRFACGDMRDHIVSYQNDHRPSYWRRRALRQQARLEIDFSEILRSYDFRLLQQYPPEAVVPVKSVFDPLQTTALTRRPLRSNSGRVRVPAVSLTLASDLRSRHSGREEIPLLVVKLPFHEADRTASAHDPTGAQHSADFRRRDEVHLDLKCRRELSGAKGCC